MKKLLTLIAIAVISLSVNAQKDVTTFLGIPVDGTKAEMIQKLKAKGFTSTSYGKDIILEGEFNGTKVDVHIGTNGDKVYRIMVADANTTNETNIKIRFNNLCRQFEKNGKYIVFNNQEIPEDEDISTQISVYDKRYQASYYQKPDMEKIDTLYMQQEYFSRLSEKFTLEQIQNPTEEIKTEMLDIAENLEFDILTKKSVWFMISKLNYDEYYIVMYYDNEYNHADGEDL